ncbi:MAG: hypothetical protein OEY18_15335, partial [Candidatus Aminicenantes bacterium]|nr:hypothetical protein [Candidatus Aminicenantes bacterium]
MFFMFFRRRKERKLAEAMRTSTLNGDVERVKALLKENPGLANTQDEYGITPLHRAGNANVAELLISKGAD